MTQRHGRWLPRWPLPPRPAASCRGGIISRSNATSCGQYIEVGLGSFGTGSHVRTTMMFCGLYPATRAANPRSCATAGPRRSSAPTRARIPSSPACGAFALVLRCQWSRGLSLFEHGNQIRPPGMPCGSQAEFQGVAILKDAARRIVSAGIHNQRIVHPFPDLMRQGGDVLREVARMINIGEHRVRLRSAGQSKRAVIAADAARAVLGQIGIVNDDDAGACWAGSPQCS